MSNDTKGYIFPDDWDAHEDTYCFKVYVPRRAEYLAAFWGAYTFFGEWLAWMRDPLKRGKDVAALWRNSINQARSEFERTKGECMSTIIDVRANPLDPCDIQVQYDDSAEWVHKFTISDCGCQGGCSSGALRVNGTQIQQYDPCVPGNWKDLGPAQAPGSIPTPPAPYPDTDCGNGLAAANLARVLEDSKNKMCTTVSTLTSFALTVVDIVSAAAAIFGFWVAEPFIAFLQASWEYLTVHYADVAAHDLYAQLSPILPAYFAPDGTMNGDQWSALLARILTMRDAAGSITSPSAEWSALGYAYAWIQAAGSAGCTRAAQAGGVLTFDCSSAEWIDTFDLRVTPGPFHALPQEGSGTLQGRWVAGQGWMSVYSCDTDHASAQRTLRVQADAPEGFEVLEVAAWWDMTHGAGAPTVPVNLFATSGVNPMWSTTTDGVDQEHGWAGDVSGNTWMQMFLYVGQGGTCPDDPGGVGRFWKLNVHGKGPNPWPEYQV